MDKSGIQPQVVENIPLLLIVLIRTNINFQELVVDVLLREKCNRIYHVTMLDSHTVVQLDLNKIKNILDEPIVEHGEWMLEWIQ